MVLRGVDPVVRVMWHLQSWQTVIQWDRISVSLIAQGKKTGLAAERDNTWSSGVPLGKNVWSADEVRRPCRGRCVEICEYSFLLALSHLYTCVISSFHGEVTCREEWQLNKLTWNSLSHYDSYFNIDLNKNSESPLDRLWLTPESLLINALQVCARLQLHPLLGHDSLHSFAPLWVQRNSLRPLYGVSSWLLKGKR